MSCHSYCQAGDWLKYKAGEANQSFYYNQLNGDFQWSKPEDWKGQEGEGSENHSYNGEPTISEEGFSGEAAATGAENQAAAAADPLLTGWQVCLWNLRG